MRGQAAVEFLLLLGILSVIFAISVNYYLGYSVNSDSLQQQENYKSICKQINDEIRSALYAGSSYERTFYLPAGNYNISMQDYDIGIAYSGGAAHCPTYINNSQNLSIGRNTIIYNETGVFID